MKKERLFDINSLEINPLYISPTEKRKWTVAFTKWCKRRKNMRCDSTLWVLWQPTRFVRNYGWFNRRRTRK